MAEQNNQVPPTFTEFSTNQRALLKKLKSIYEEIDHVEKKGKNVAQGGYDYLKAVDVARAIRQALVKQNIYALPRFYVLRDYQITTSRGNTLQAVDLDCQVTWYDVETGTSLVTNGLGSGSDITDKHMYKAQTGAIKYALRNAFLLPDESDPENEPAERPQKEATTKKAAKTPARKVTSADFENIATKLEVTVEQVNNFVNSKLTSETSVPEIVSKMEKMIADNQADKLKILVLKTVSENKGEK